MKGNKAYKPKPIKRLDHTGAMVNYGVLEVGIVAGIRCLAPKETLLLLGAGLAKQKVPDYFYTNHYIKVPHSSKLQLKVYAIKSTDASSLAARLSARTTLKVALLMDTIYGNTAERWCNGEKEAIRGNVVQGNEIKSTPLPEVKLEPVHHKRRKPGGKLRRFLLAVKSLFWR